MSIIEHLFEVLPSHLDIDVFSFLRHWFATHHFFEVLLSHSDIDIVLFVIVSGCIWLEIHLFVKMLVFRDEKKVLFKRLEEIGACTDDGWCKLADYLAKVGLSNNQTKRYVEGKTSWKLGEGRGRNLKAKQDWDNKPGGRGGVPPVFVRVAVLREVFAKYHGQRQLRL